MKKILVVDDSAENLKIVENVLKDQYKLILVKSGKNALTYLAKNTVDLVLLDIMMPEMDGFEIYEKIREMEKQEKVPVIFLTADVGSALTTLAIIEGIASENKSFPSGFVPSGFSTVFSLFVLITCTFCV